MARGSHCAGVMTPWNEHGRSSKPSFASLIARVRASTWPAVAARALGVVVALFVLGWIGRTAAAGPPTAMSLAAGDRDASVPAPLAPVETVVPVDAGPPMMATAAVAPHGRASPTEPVYLNHASVDELRRLPGVGPKRAEAILVLRQRVGRFQRIEDLLRVKGVGRGAVKKWRPLVRLDAPSAPSAPSIDGGSL